MLLPQFYERGGEEARDSLPLYHVTRTSLSVDGLCYSVPLYSPWRLGLTRHCAKRDILQNVTLHVPEGSIMAVMGNSG